MVKLDIYTYNVLNPDINVTNILFRELSNGNFKEKIERAQSIAKIDLERYPYRMNIIIDMINDWLKSNSLICLQEVCDAMLIELQKKYNIIHTKNKDMIMFNNNKLFKNEYRVIIYSKNIKLINTQEIEIQTDFIRKNILYGLFSINENRIQCINLHSHWKNDITEIQHITTKISEVLNSDPFVICGDFNKNYKNPIISKTISDKLKIANTNDLYDTDNKYTNISSIKDIINVNIYTDIKNEQIRKFAGLYTDYILVGKSDKITFNKMKIIDTYKNNHIIYNLPILLEGGVLIDSYNKILTLAPNIYKEYAENWIKINKKDKHLDLSDHTPVTIQLTFK